MESIGTDVVACRKVGVSLHYQNASKYDQLHILTAQETIKVNSLQDSNYNQLFFRVHQPGKYKWLQMTIFTISVLSGQSVATLLGRLYFNKGGNSIWLVTLVQTAGFPVLLPFLFFAPTNTKDTNDEKPSSLILALLYILLGLFLAMLCLLYSIGLMYLPVSTYSLICASQLGFNAVFSFFLNQQKFTPFLVNSVFILTLSSVLLVFQNDSGRSTKTSERKYAIGFICTVTASAGYALMLSLTQLSYKTIVKEENLRAVLALIIYQSMVASSAIVLGLSVSGQWESVRGEMEKFRLGKVSYLMILVWKAISWQVFSIGIVGLTFKVSSLFSNVVSTMGLPIVPVLAVVLFHDKMNGVKMVSMILAIWGFLSYIYQHYLDDLETKSQRDAPNNSTDVHHDF